MAKNRVRREPVVQPPDQSIKLIALTKGLHTVVSAHRYELLNQWNWCARWNKPTKSFYAVRGQGIYMHREILGLKKGDPREGDHIESGQTLDNSDSNLRISTRAQNGCNTRMLSTNTSGAKGVNYDPRLRKPWRARIMVQGKTIGLGSYVTREEACAAYDEGARKYHGEFANPVHSLS